MAANNAAEKGITTSTGDPDLESQTTQTGDKSEGSLHQNPNQDEGKETADIVDWNGPDDPMNPQNWPQMKKLTILAVIALMAFIT